MKSLNKWKKHRISVLSRLLGLYLFLGVWSLTLVGRLVYLQIFKSEEYRLKAETAADRVYRAQSQAGRYLGSPSGRTGH